MVAKRKAVSTLTKGAKTTSKAQDADAVNEEVDQDVDQQIVVVEQNEPTEKDLVAARTKELKAMSAVDMRALVTSHGMDTGNKEDMIKKVLQHEAKLRKTVQEHKARIRAVVVEKKEQLEKMPASELSKLCESVGLKGIKSKPERVQRLLVQWQENDGVEKALTDLAQKERASELKEMDIAKLQKLCHKSGVDPYVKEIMVDRVSTHEFQKGVYARPVIKTNQEAPREESTTNLIDVVLANDAKRKKEQEVKAKREEVAINKLKELKSLSIDDLKKRLSKKGIESSGKKEEMMQALLTALMEEENMVERKTVLKSKSQAELKEILTRNGLSSAGGKEDSIKSILAFEAKQKDDLKVFESKIQEVIQQKKVAMQSQSNAALKDMCASQGLPVGGGKEERIERLAEKLHDDPSLDALVSKEIRSKRREKLMSMEKKEVIELCQEMEIEPWAKEIMVERLLAHESEAADAIALPNTEPPTKKARTLKK
jgi:hypothetical protein